MFDQLGGLSKLVNGKTVAMKINLTGNPTHRLGLLPQSETFWVHPQIVGAVIHLLGKAGAKRIRVLESSDVPPLPEFLIQAGWNPGDLTSAASRVELINTNYPGPDKKFTRFWVPGGGLMFKGYDLNSAYDECDFFVSLAKLKEHITAGVTLSMKNCFGIMPATIYGAGAGIDEPSKTPVGARVMMHAGNRQPSKCSPSELHPESTRDAGYRVPHITADLVAARPIHLAIIDGIASMAGGEGPWVKLQRPRRSIRIKRALGLSTPMEHPVHPLRPGILVAGTNCVTTDAVATALMGFDPMADRGTAPFEDCDSTLKLAEQLGLGTRDLRRIEVRGVPIEQARTLYRST